MSFLGKYYARIRGSQEDIATEGLVHILQNSPACRQAIEQLLQRETGAAYDSLSFASQSVGENQERPDIVSLDSDGKERLIIEAKFWASLTSNQPGTYLNRLSGEKPVLMFVCPEQRPTSLAAKVDERLKAEGFLANWPNNRRAELTNGTFILIKTWTDILSLMRSVLSEERDTQLLADLYQIEGFCRKIDEESFQAITDEDLSPALPRRILSYYRLIDKLADELKRAYGFSSKGLKRTPQSWGYATYISKGSVTLRIDCNLAAWRDKSDTPFFLLLTDNYSFDGVLLRKLRKQITSHEVFDDSGAGLIALKTTIGAEESDLIASLAEQIVSLVDTAQKIIDG